MAAWFFLGVTVIATVVAQLLFKYFHTSKARIHLVAAIGLFGLAVPCTIIAARDLGIGRVYIAMALTYALAPVAGRIFFNERVNRTQWFALALISSGVLLYNV
ncbi:MAG: DMT family transporter [Lysobacter sp.]